MANKSSSNLKRKEISYFEGCNSLVSDNLFKKEELSHIENARSKTIGTVEKREGSRLLGSALTATANYGLFFFENTTATGFYRISTVSSTTSIYYLNGSAVWTILSGEGTGLTAANFDFTIAENCCFLTNYSNPNRYIGSNGTTVTKSTDSYVGNHLYNSPNARKINYYKDRLYVADYINTTRVKNGVMMSSTPLGILGLVDGDFSAGDCIADAWIDVTDTKYIYSTDTVDVYRGNNKIADITIKAKTESSFQINAITFAGSYTTLNSADEVWVDGTFTGTRVFRWAGNPESGVDVKEYDTFKIAGGQNDRIKMFENVSNVMMIANDHNIAIWDGGTLSNFDLGIGCISDRGYVKTKYGLWFLGFDGIFLTTGGIPVLKSSKVQKYFNGASKASLQAGAMGKKGESIFCYIGDTTLYNPDGSIDKTLSDVVLELNIQQDNWYVHTGIKATQFATYISSDNVDRLEFSSTETGYEVREFLRDTTDDSTGDDKEILFRVDTGNITLSSNFENICYPMEIIVETERGSNIKAFISLDGDDFYEIKGDAKKGCTILKVTSKDGDVNAPPRCRRLKLSLRDYSKMLCKISRVAIIYSETTEEENYRSSKND